MLHVLMQKMYAILDTLLRNQKTKAAWYATVGQHVRNSSLLLATGPSHAMLSTHTWWHCRKHVIISTMSRGVGRTYMYNVYIYGDAQDTLRCKTRLALHVPSSA